MNWSNFPASMACFNVSIMGFYQIMTVPASRKNTTASKVLPIVGGFVLFSAVAAFDQRLALALAVGTIGFAAISMLVAVFRKH
jgi:hypothetical protein